MPFDLSWRQIAVAASIAAIVVVAFTLLSADKAPSPGPVTGYLPLVTQTPIPPSVKVADVVGPGSTSHSSALVMVQGMRDRRLVIWSLVGNDDPVEVDRKVAYGPLQSAPDAQQVFYSTEHTAMVLDVEARRAIIVGELPPAGEVMIAQWSPDGSALAYVVFTDDFRIAYTTRADGTSVAQEMRRVPRGLSLDVGWLPDGRPVVIYLGVGPVGGLEARYDAFDPVTGDVMPLSPDVEVIQMYTPWRAPDGSQQVFPMASWQEALYKSGCRQASLGLAGSEWLGVAMVAVGSSQAAVFTVPNVYLDDPVWLRDGRVLMRGIADESCPSSGSGLYIAAIGEAPETLITTDTIYTTDQRNRLLWGPAYAVSQDQTLVAWVENQDSERSSTIYLTPLDGGEPEVLYRTEARVGIAPQFHYKDSLVILDFIWLP